MSLFAYIPARFMITGIVVGTSATDVMVVETIPFIAALVCLAMVVFAVK